MHAVLNIKLLYFIPILVWFVGIPSQTQAQQLREGDTLWHVVGSAGDVDTAELTPGEGWTIEWTIGEVFVEPLQGSKRRITPGFHQHWLDIPNSIFQFSVLDLEEISQHFMVFPNPVFEDLTIKWDFEEDLNLLFEIYCLSGRRVLYQRQNAENSQLTIRLSHLNPQFYILRISDPSRGFFETHTIFKL